eukprot:Gb_15886 [translate_table: standard]
MGCEEGYVRRDMSVALTQVVPVYPFPAQSKDTVTTLRLSNLDRKCPMLMYTVFFYRPAQDLSAGSVFQTLKTAMEKTLGVWYPAAGRLKINEHDGKLDLLCNNAGAVLVEACTDVSLSELGDMSQYNPFFEKLVYKPAFTATFSEMPLMVAQRPVPASSAMLCFINYQANRYGCLVEAFVHGLRPDLPCAMVHLTKFACGELSLGFGTSHSLFDGLGAITFLKAWASMATTTTDISTLPHPLHERTPLLVRPSASAVTPEQNIVVPFEHLNELIERGMKSDEKKLWECRFNGMSWANQSGYALKTFTVTKQMVDNLKRKTLEESGSSTCSAFDVVAAHLWRARVKALGLSSATTVCLQFTVDARKRLLPPLPKEFTGNAYVMASVSCTVGTLEQESLSITVARIRKAKDSVTDEYIKCYLRALDAPQRALPSLRGLTLVSDWRRTPFHTVDFGLGKALYAAPLASPVPQSAYLLQDPTDVERIHVRLGLLPEHVSAFYRYFMSDH